MLDSELDKDKSNLAHYSTVLFFTSVPGKPYKNILFLMINMSVNKYWQYINILYPIVAELINVKSIHIYRAIRNKKKIWTIVTCSLVVAFKLIYNNLCYFY